MPRRPPRPGCPPLQFGILRGIYGDLENLALVPGSPPSVMRVCDPLVTNGRQFFAKISYLFRS